MGGFPFFLLIIQRLLNLIGQSSANGDGSWFVYAYTDGRLCIGRTGVNQICSAAGSVVSDAWQHIAVTRTNAAGTTNMYVNGTNVLSNNTTVVWNASTNPLFITKSGGPVSPFTGYMDEIRISKNVIQWTTNFTPPTEPYSFIENNSTYTLTSDDISKYLKFEVTPDAATGETPGVATLSSATGAISAANAAPTATSVAYTGTETEGETLTGSYTYNDVDGDVEGISTFQWYRADDVGGTNEAAISGATSSTYTLVSADIGKHIKFEVTPVAAAGVSPGTAVSSSYSGAIEAADRTKLLLLGDGTGQTFTDSSAFAHTVTANGDATQSTTAFKYGGSSMYFDGTGDYLEIPVHNDWNFGTGDFTVDFWVNPDGTGTDQGLVSCRNDGTPHSDNEWTIKFYDNANRVEWHSGVAIIKEATESVAASTWTHVAVVRYNDTVTIYYDGVAKGSTSDTRDYNNCSDLGIGADFYAQGAPTLLPGYMDEVRVTNGEALWTTGFTPPSSLAPNGAPYATNVAITGDAADGQTLTGNYSYNDDHGDAQGTSTFRWLRADTVDGTYTEIVGATASTYTLTASDVDKYIKFEITPIAQNDPTNGNPVLSAATGQIVASNFAPTASSVAITGNTTIGSELTGTYTFADVDGDLEGTSLYRWLRADTAGGTYTEIVGATAVTYTLQVADISKYIKFEVTPVAQTGITPGVTVLSSASSQVTGNPPTASNVTTTGTFSVGQTLTGSYTYADNESDLEGTTTFRWLVSDTSDGTYAPITGATSSTLVITSAQASKYIKFEVTPVAQNSPATGTPVLSSASSQVAQPYTIETWPKTLSPEGDIIAYIKVWKNAVAHTPDDIVLELRAASGNTVLAVHTLSSGALTHCGQSPENCISNGDGAILPGSYATRLDGTHGVATFKTTFSAVSPQDVRLVAYAYDNGDNLLVVNTHNDFTESPVVLPAVTLNPVTTPTNLLIQTITGGVVEQNLEASPSSVKVNGVDVSLLNALGGGSWEFTKTDQSLIEGSNTITVVATDLSGNQGTATATIIVDNTAPTAATLQYPVDANPPTGGSAAGYSRSGEVLLRWIAATDTHSSIEHYEVWRKAVSHTPRQGQSNGDDDPVKT